MNIEKLVTEKTPDVLLDFGDGTQAMVFELPNCEVHVTVRQKTSVLPYVILSHSINPPNAFAQKLAALVGDTQQSLGIQTPELAPKPFKC